MFPQRRVARCCLRPRNAWLAILCVLSLVELSSRPVPIHPLLLHRLGSESVRVTVALHLMQVLAGRSLHSSEVASHLHYTVHVFGEVLQSRCSAILRMLLSEASSALQHFMALFGRRAVFGVVGPNSRPGERIEWPSTPPVP